MSHAVASGDGTSRAREFFGLPRTTPGKVAAWLLVAAVVMMLGVSAGLDALGPVVGRAIVWAEVAALFSAGLTAGVALVRIGERSWVLWLAAALAAVVLGAEVISMFVGE
jgi:hypothetical protein